ncbi:MAG: acyl-CoA dehydrogenase family protein [Alphaproteobacteria bacterium]
MEFALSEDQRLLADSIKSFLDETVPLDETRKVATENDTAVKQRMTEGLGALGVNQILVPEAHGGLGLAALDAALVHEALGFAAAPISFTGTMMASRAIAEAGTEDQKADWFGKLVNGEVRFGIAMTERVNVREGAGLSEEDGKLSGKALFAFDCDDATHIITADQSGALYIVAADAAGLTRNDMPNIDRTRMMSELLLDGVDAVRLDGENEPGNAAARVIELGRVLLAADTLGAMQNMLDQAVEYAGGREQFGRVIGSFQAVKHMCAEMVAEVEPLRALVWHAAHAIDTDPDEGPVLACLAKALAADSGQFVARTSTEVHGGMGFTDLVGLHYWFKRIGLNRQLLGGPERVREDAAKLQGWAA